MQCIGMQVANASESLKIVVKLYGIRYEFAHITSVAVYITDNGGAVCGVLWMGDQEDAVHFWGEFTVYLGNGFFKLEIFSIAQAAYHVVGTYASAKVDGEPFVVSHLDLVFKIEGLFDPFLAVIKSKHVFFFGIKANGYNDFIEEWKRSFDEVFVAFGDGIE
jgi:hypothetical protein